MYWKKSISFEGIITMKIFRQLFIAILLISVHLFTCQGAPERKPYFIFPDGKAVYFLDGDEARLEIVNDGITPYFKLLSPMEISYRMGQSMNHLSALEARKLFKKYNQDNVRDWKASERIEVLKSLKETYMLLNNLNPDLVPKKWQFIKTTGKEEGGAYYTRTNNIIVPENALYNYIVRKRNITFLQKMLHETFHVYSRYNPQKRNDLFKVIGFNQAKRVELDPGLKKRKFTNPDATDYNYLITLKDNKGVGFKAILLIYSRYPKYIPGAGNLFQNMKVGLFRVNYTNGVWKTISNGKDLPYAIGVGEARGFYEQVGRNTSYLIHPEEIIADNITQLAMILKGNKDLKGNREGLKLYRKLYQVIKKN